MGGRQPKRLATTTEREHRRSRLHEPHVQALTAWVDRLRRETSKTSAIPYFDPLDGGAEARVLFLLEAPGPKAVETGFVSRDNPDDSAKNLLLACDAAGLDRDETALWNVVPWYLGSGGRIRPATKRDLADGVRHLPGLVRLLPSLSLVVLMDGRAQSVEAAIRALLPNRVAIHRAPHPSPQFVNRHPANRERLVASLREVAAALQERHGRSA